MRVNPTQKTHFIDYSSDRGNQSVRRPSIGTPKPLPLDAVKASTYTTLWDEGTYQTGMGEVTKVQRPGSDTKHIKSKGYFC